jgi:Ca2+-binding RTX toxin-like protein
MKRTAMTMVMTVAVLVVALSGAALATSSYPFVYGTDGPDRISGTAQPDNVKALGGADLVSGRGDGDLLYGNSGRDVVAGGPGRDALYGGSGNDFIDGLTVKGDPANPERGKDTIHCGDGRDDTVVANPFDYVAADCEHVSRDGRSGG